MPTHEEAQTIIDDAMPGHHIVDLTRTPSSVSPDACSPSLERMVNAYRGFTAEQIGEGAGREEMRAVETTTSGDPFLHGPGRKSVVISDGKLTGAQG